MTKCVFVPLAFFALGTAVFAQQASDEPTQGGKTLSQWVKLLDDANADTRVAAASAIGKMGAKAKSAVPALLASLKDPEAKVRLVVAEALYAVGGATEPTIPVLIELLDHEDAKVHDPAIALLGRTGPIAPLGKALSSPSARTRKHTAAAFLRMSGSLRNTSPAVSVLLTALDDPDPEVRMNVCAALVAIDGGKAAPAVPKLIAFLADKNSKVRQQAVFNLRMLGATANPAVDALLPLLKDENLDLRQSAAGTLITISPSQAAPAVPVLAEAIQLDPKAKWAVQLALQLGPTAAPLIPALLPLLKHKDVNMRFHAAQALVAIDAAHAESAAAIFAAILADTTKPATILWHEVFNELQRLGPRGKPAAPVVMSMLKEPKADFSAKAAVTLAIVDPSASDVALDYLHSRLANERDPRDTMNAMRRLGPAAKPAIPELIALLKSEHRAGAADVLRRIGPAVVPALKAFLENMDTLAMLARFDVALTLVDIDPKQAETAAVVFAAIIADGKIPMTVNPTSVFMELQRLGTQGKSAAPVLRLILKEPKAVFGSTAAVTLAIVDPSAAEFALDYVRSRLANERDPRDTMNAMWRLGPAAKPAVPELITLLKAEHQVAAARLLGQIGPSAKDAVPALKALLESDDPNAIGSARQALRLIERTETGKP